MSSKDFNPEEVLKSGKLTKLAVPATDGKGRQVKSKLKIKHVPRVLSLKQGAELLAKGSIMPTPEVEADEIEQAIKEEAAEKAGKMERPAQSGPAQSESARPITPYEANVWRYLKERSKITFELDSGFYTLPVISVTVSECGIMIMMPAGNSDTTFAPKPGANVGIRFEAEHFDCYSPGTIFTIPELEVMIIVLIRKDIIADEPNA